jgi:curved DNA-binding protein CbpA
MTSEDARMVMHVINNRNDYFKILGRGEGEELKRNYKKLCLQIHPDKNKHPKAEEAFKVLGEAYAVLLDPMKRSAYERHGAEGARRMESTGSPYAPQGQYYRRRHPAENFENFFDPFRRQQRGGQGVHVQEFELNGNLMMALPLLFFFLMAFLLQSLTMSDSQSATFRPQRSSQLSQLYSLKEDDEFIIERTTDVDQFPQLRVPYYVSRYFYDQMRMRRTNLRTVEIEVLRSYRDQLHRRCVSERLQKQRKQHSCDQLERFHGLP